MKSQNGKKHLIFLVLFFIAITLSFTYAGKSNIVYEDNNRRINSYSDKSINFGKKTLNKGIYKISCNIEKLSNNNDKILGNLIINSLNNLQESSFLEIYNKDFIKHKNKIELIFHINQNNTIINPYIYINQNTIFLVENIKIKLIEKSNINENNKNLRKKIYEENKLFKTTGKIVNDKTANNKFAILAEGKKDRNKHMIFGPYSKNEKTGNHTAIFRLKVSNNTINKNIAKIEVFNTNGNGISKFINLKTTDFKEKNKYQEFKINYTRTNEGSIEFRVLYYGHTKLFFDNVTNIGEY